MTDQDDVTSSTRSEVGARSRWLWVWAVACVVVTVAAFVVGTQVRSPWESAIASSRSTPMVTARAEVRALSSADAPITGTVSLGTEQSVTPLGDGATRQVVTAVNATAGQQLAPGQAVVELSGRPMIALVLPFPLYRDIVGGDEGPDVRAVQQSLTDLGIYHGTVDGVYGRGTARAVEALYKRAHALHPKAAEHAAPDSASTSVDDAASAAAAAAAAAAAELAALTPLPVAEVLAVGPGGSTVVSVAPVGTVIGDAAAPVATIRSGSPTVVARVGVDRVEQLSVGASVQVTAVGDAALSVTATVASIGAFVASSTDTGQPPGRDVTFALGSGAAFDNGADVLITESQAAEPVEGLAVPLVAVRKDSVGTYVQRLPADGLDEKSAERVSVTLVTTGEGFAIVEPGELRQDDVVIVSQAL